ncbi:MAG TPA: bifunctional 4-hydroxy-2-oxoglutarate aldolase/2-dehydro-3-deoxy-phosphogluconate aldolase [Propionibacteriaceae bacterium]|nr:bifunctional 4-hydroxy-2-oxoglutarate aldolase/2-dehydro-3-deoxy-phosphogluconate aldolase [Propionibacteriaceae bacterium]HPZ49594.1 bifunctional 4-hydroxy-2-oxoglutarate aldolase/2-dehydro-3-deoxy-phosphogluconate aldolase [Propionibacteriaceae bacterium]
MASDHMFAHRVVPVVVIDDAKTAKPLAEAMVAGGLPVAEVTFRTDAAAAAISAMRDVEGLILGAGTVVNPEQVRMAVDCGATFLVSPGLRPDVVEAAQAFGVPILPGCVTPTEIMQAQSFNLDVVKFFPANVYGGAAAIKALSAPFGGMRFVPTGGVSAANIGDFLSLSCIPAVGGSWMVPVDKIRAGEYDAITQLCAEAVAAAAAV